ncbi:hypothetical protein FOB63_004819 [Clavispora lusitaniae]|uniref:uncharacterized protein n=1 Tax=Clavispora lusitaniae TaxID=36911 RepID=UPI001693B3E5|nr:Altered inheritance of mitochondria protein 6 [Clavispora lusitaniae]KAF7579749.1 hypothetical protein FOB63_004819 [Clavispora lusitaniae]
MINVFRPHYDKPEPPPTIESLTRDVHLKPIHSHNDYWRQRPLLDALSHGCVSVEGDIWHFDHDYTVTDTTTSTTAQFRKSEVYVGHNRIFLHPENTLEHLYFDPIYKFLESANKKFSDPVSKDVPFSVFYNAPEIPLYFWLDFKTEGRDLYVQVQKRLERFIKHSYLGYYDNEAGQHKPGPLVITLTGNVPWELLEAEKTKRYVYGDCPLHKMLDASDEDMAKYARQCVFASASLEQLLGKEERSRAERSGLNKSQGETLKKYFERAHSVGIKTRIWGGVDWPIHVRDNHWQVLWELGCDLINADDLAAAANVF